MGSTSSFSLSPPTPSQAFVFLSRLRLFLSPLRLSPFPLPLPVLSSPPLLSHCLPCASSHPIVGRRRWRFSLSFGLLQSLLLLFPSPHALPVVFSPTLCGLPLPFYGFLSALHAGQLLFAFQQFLSLYGFFPLPRLQPSFSWLPSPFSFSQPQFSFPQLSSSSL